MRILSVSLDKRVLDPQSAVAKRQAEYYRGHDVEYIVLDGSAKFSSFFSAWQRARKARGFDLVTAQDPLACGWIGFVASRAARCALQVQDHSGQVSGILAPFVLKRADRVRTVSQRGNKNLLGIGVTQEKIDVIPIATDISRFSSIQRKAEKNILCIARLEKEKGVDVLLDAFVELKKSHPDYALTIVGDGSMRSELEARNSGADFAGNQDDVRPYLERAALYVQPSHFEGWGLAVVEAAAAGLPIVMSDVGLAGEVIKDGESGLVVPPGDAHALADAIETLLEDPALAERLGAQARMAVHRLPTPERSVELVRASFEAAYRKPRLLIITQAIDRDDPVLGFFHHWVEKFSEQADLRVICLRRGSYDLPDVNVLSLGKEEGIGRFGRVCRFASVLWRIRHDYDSVFVHMNDVYVVLAGWWWRMTGKRVGLWRNHPQGTWMTPIAVLFAHAVFCTSPHAFTARYAKTSRMPAGIDTDLFRPEAGTRIPGSMLFFGRLSRIKHPEMFLRALGKLKDEVWTARIVGDPLPQDGTFGEELHRLAADLGIRDRVSFEPAISQDEAPALFASSAIYVNATPTGSYDKTVIEAMASACLVAVGNRNFEGEIDPKFVWNEGDDASLAETLRILLKTPGAEGRVLREYAVKTHGLETLIRQLLAKLR
ncbi:MAG TPA: glycosyltransferase [Verrucomicrobiae bacterium]|nr:glycosyltransferase [Verrucomicrobiae bacterium]